MSDLVERLRKQTQAKQAAMEARALAEFSDYPGVEEFVEWKAADRIEELEGREKGLCKTIEIAQAELKERQARIAELEGALKRIAEGKYPKHDIETFGDEADTFARAALEDKETIPVRGIERDLKEFDKEDK